MYSTIYMKTFHFSELNLSISTPDNIITNDFHLVYDYWSSSDIFCKFFVVVTTALDYEQRRNYTFTVVAIDTTGYSSDTLVTVSVLPVNEYAPHFSLSQ